MYSIKIIVDIKLGLTRADRMNELINRIYTTSSVCDSQGRQVDPFPVSISRPLGEELYRFTSVHRLTTTLEVGLAYGLSALFICQAHRDKRSGKHVAIDPAQFSKFNGIGLHNIEYCGLQDILTFYEAPSYLVLPELVRKQTAVDMVFIDGNHRFDYAIMDFFFADKLLPVGRFVVFHDLWMPSISKLVRFVLLNRNYRLTGFGLTADPGDVAMALTNRANELNRHSIEFGVLYSTCMLQKTASDDRAWDFHVDF